MIAALRQTQKWVVSGVIMCVDVNELTQMTLLIVALLGNRTKQEWYQWVKERVENKVGYETPESVPPVFRSHLQQNDSSQALFGGNSPAQRNVALSLNGLGSGGLLSAIPRVLAGQNGDEGTQPNENADAATDGDKEPQSNQEDRA